MTHKALNKTLANVLPAIVPHNPLVCGRNAPKAESISRVWLYLSPRGQSQRSSGLNFVDLDLREDLERREPYVLVLSSPIP
jgi:hypothetical protein